MEKIIKMISIGNGEMNNFLHGIFSEPYVCPVYCGFVCPQLDAPFEILVPIEIWNSPIGPGVEEEIRFLEPGIYRIGEIMTGNTSHFVIMQKYEDGKWGDEFGCNGGWSDGAMIDWRGIQLANVPN